LRRLTLALTGLCVCVLCAGAINGTAAIDSQERALTALGAKIATYQQQTWHWQRVMGLPRAKTTGDSLRELGLRGSVKALNRWKRLAATTYKRLQRPPHRPQLECIHRYEGSWTDTGAPFWGGLQMDLSFQASYGGYLFRTKGTADRWTPLEQMWVAEKAVRSRGFYPWPNTARYCGLI
jgi:hypothetical protein